MKDFRKKYKEYRVYMKLMHDAVFNIVDYETYLKITDKVNMSEQDFQRYKDHTCLNEKDFWNASLDKEKIRDKAIKLTLKSL